MPRFLTKFDSDMKNSNVIIQQFIAVVNNQLRENEPTETRQTLERLQRLGYSEEAAKMMMAQCVGREITAVLQSGQLYNHERYIASLHQLPDMDFEQLELGL